MPIGNIRTGHECWHGNWSIMCNGDKLPPKKRTHTLSALIPKRYYLSPYILWMQNTQKNNRKIRHLWFATAIYKFTSQKSVKILKQEWPNRPGNINSSKVTEPDLGLWYNRVSLLLCISQTPSYSSHMTVYAKHGGHLGPVQNYDGRLK